MPEQLTSALLLASWTSIVWAPLTMAGTVWIGRYRWPVAVVIGIALIGLFCWSFLFQSLLPVCRGAGDAEIILCREEGMVLGLLQLLMIGAACFATGFFILGELIRGDQEYSTSARCA